MLGKIIFEKQKKRTNPAITTSNKKIAKLLFRSGILLQKQINSEIISVSFLSADDSLIWKELIKS